MEQYQKRVVEEKEALDEKIAKLGEFVDSNTFHRIDGAEQTRLSTQLKIMRSYSSILGDRINNFPADEQ